MLVDGLLRGYTKNVPLDSLSPYLFISLSLEI